MIANQRESLLVRAALESKDYRNFLSSALTATTRKGAKPNIAALSRKAGFSSRSFIGEVISGRRRLSAQSYPKLTRALALPTRIKNYFHLLVVREEEELNFENLKSEQIEAKLSELRAKLSLQLEEADRQRSAVTSLLKGRDLLDCYAALGSSDTGSALEEVIKKTGLPIQSCQHALNFLIDKKVVGSRDSKFFALNSLFFVNGLGEDLGLKSCYLQTLDELKRKATTNFNAPDRGFFQFVYSTNRSRLPELKQKLWEVLQEFVEESEVPDGDSVVKLMIGLYA